MTDRETASDAHDAVLGALARLVPARSLITSETGRKPYETDGFPEATGLPLAVVLPETTSQVQAVVRACFQAGVPVVPRGAGTNLTGGTVPIGDCVMVGTTRMRRILNFDPVNGTIRVEAGGRNQAVSDHVRDAGWFYAPDPSSRRTCTIGGNIATNSGGAACLRHGVTVNNVAGATLVLPDGESVEFGGEGFETEGYDLTGLLCGSEGQLGIVTEAVLRLVPRPEASWSLMLAFDSSARTLEAAHEIFARGILPRQIDFMDVAAVSLCEAFAASGYPTDAGALLLIELEGCARELEAQAETIRAIAPGTAALRIARDPDTAAALWRGRNAIYGAAGRNGAYVSLDCAVPLSAFAAVLGAIAAEAEARAVPAATVLHAGDGTVHTFLFHAIDDRDAAERARACADAIRRACIRLGGSISAEYGIGLQKQSLMAEQFTTDDLAVQQRCIDAFQGDTVFNPGKVFPPSRKAAA